LLAPNTFETLPETFTTAILDLLSLIRRFDLFCFICCRFSLVLIADNMCQTL
jgi:hypothetical protein